MPGTAHRPDVIEDGIRFPATGDEAVEVLLIGSLLLLLSAAISFVGMLLTIFVVGFLLLPIAVIPRLLVDGYLLRVLTTTTHGGTEPPPFDEWGDLFVDGIRVWIVRLVYAVVVFVAFVGFLIALLVGIEANGGLPGAASAVAVILTGLLFVVVAVVTAYVYPLSLATMAYEDDLAAAFAPRPIRDVALSGSWLVGWIVAAVVVTVGATVGLPFTVLLVGFAVLFYAQVAGHAVYGYAFADALDSAEGRHDTGGEAGVSRESDDGGSGPRVGDETGIGDDEPDPTGTETDVSAADEQPRDTGTAGVEDPSTAAEGADRRSGAGQ